MTDPEALPSVNLDAEWSAIHAPDAKRQLINFVDFVFSTNGMPPQRTGLYRSVLLTGEKGCGKTTLARGLANELARRHGPGLLYTLSPKDIFSAHLGESVQRLGNIFDVVELSARSKLTVVMLDEVEAIALDRLKMAERQDNPEAHRVLSELLQRMDRLRGHPRALVVATSNFVHTFIDGSFLDRVDWIISIDAPGACGRAAILRDSFDVFGLEVKAGLVREIVRGTQGLNGRQLRHLIVVAGTLAGKAAAKLEPDDLRVAVTWLRSRSEAQS